MEQINLNIMPDGVMPVCHASQFDKNRTIRFNLNQNGSVYTLAGTETITCKVRKPDDTESTINVANTSSSYVYVTFGFSDTDLSGYAMCELKIVNGAQTIGSRNFLLNVEADAYDGSVFEERSASGEIASFETNFIDNLTECIVDIDAVQDLHGYSKPWSGGGGKNKAHVTATSQTINEVAYTVATDGRVKANGTADGTSILDLGTITLTGGTSYILSGCPLGGSGLTYALFLRGSGSFTQKLDFGTGVSFTVTDTVTTTLSMIVYNGYNINNLIFEPMVRLSNTSAEFEPYENICPISGHTEANLVRCGKNLLDKTLLLDQVGWNIIALKLNPNTRYIVSSNMPQAKTSELPFYTFNSTGNPSASTIVYSGNNITVNTNADGILKIQQRRVSGTDSFANYEWQIEEGSTATAYEQYNATTYNIPFGQTVYGGTLNVSTGLLTVTHGSVVFDGSSDENWISQTYSGNTICFTNQLSDKKIGYQTSICDKFNNVNGSWGSINTAVYSDHPNSVNLYFCKPTDDFVMNVTNWQNWLSNNNIMVVYELATPQIIPLTPTEVRSLLNDNNIFADTGNIEVKYLIEVV